MSEGHAELQRIVLQYDKQLAEATRAQQEAEIVLSFLRAAVDELEALDRGEPRRVSTQKDPFAAPVSPVPATSTAPVPAVEPIAVNEKPPVPAPANSGNRATIASLIEDVSERLTEKS